MTEGIDPNKKDKIERVKVADVPLLGEILHGTDVESEYEVELRFKKARDITPDDVKGAHRTLSIRQAYVNVRNKDDTKGSVRLRITQDDEGEILRRIVVKEKAREEGRLGEIERQIVLKEDDPRGEDFEYLFEQHVGIELRKTRHYFDRVLPNGHKYQIHLDIHHGPPPEFEGFVRIEIEFFGDPEDETGKSADADAAAVAANPAMAQFPDWVGENVTTTDPRYGSRNLANEGTIPTGPYVPKAKKGKKEK
jgi:CYTH domain-containing protein